MTPYKILAQFENHTHIWIKALSEYSDSEFIMKPSANEWSMSQVYNHIILVSKACIERSKLCMEGKGELGHSGFGPALFCFMGSFPPIRLKIKEIPFGLESIYNPIEISKQSAESELILVLNEMKAVSERLVISDSNMRLKHWAGGWFNANQWFHSAEMHLKHHFRQKKRLDNSIK